MIPIHAIATPDPQQVRFVVPATHLLARGAVRRAPDRLGGWLQRGVISEMSVRDGGVLITLSEGNSWRDFGEDIRDALGDALLDPAAWQVAATADGEDRLSEIVTELLTGQIGAYAERHGGAIELVSVSGHHVTVRMSGACRGCPASGSTLTERLERELRRRVGDHVTVSAENYSVQQSLGKRLLSLLTR